MGSHSYLGDPATSAATDQAIAFLTDRLRDDLALCWDRPGAAALVAAVDEQLTTLAAGLLPPRAELRLLLWGYAAHPAYDPRWSGLLR